MRNMEWRLVWLAFALAYPIVLLMVFIMCSWSVISVKRKRNLTWGEAFAQVKTPQIAFDAIVMPAWGATTAALFVVGVLWFASII